MMHDDVGGDDDDDTAAARMMMTMISAPLVGRERALVRPYRTNNTPVLLLPAP
jgi:hypothetical protein